MNKMSSQMLARDSSPGSLLKSQLEFLRRDQPNVSLRGLAKRLKVSAPYLFRVVHDQTSFPRQRYQDFVHVFQFDSIGKEALAQAIHGALLRRLPPQPELSARRSPKLYKKRKSATGASYRQIETTKFHILQNWYSLPILDSLTCSEGFRTPEQISSRLEVPLSVVLATLEQLEREGFVRRRKNGSMSKSQLKIRFPTRDALKLVQAFHRQMLRRIAVSLEGSPDDFPRRLVNGVVFAADPKKLESAKAILNQALYEIADLMSDGTTSDVYYVSGNLIPLSRKLPST